MRCMLQLILAATVAGAMPALAGPKIPVASVAHKAPLAGDLNIRYLLRQIELNEQQAEQAGGLLESIVSDDDAQVGGVDLAQIRQLWVELGEARQNKDSKRVNQIADQLWKACEDSTLDDEFFQNFEPALNDRQKELLAEARARLNRHRSGGLRPGDLTHEARKLNLTTEQQAELFNAIKAARKRIGPILRPSEAKKAGMLNALADDIRAFLTPEQRNEFEYRIYVMRPDLIGDGLRVPKSTFKWEDAE